MCAAWKDFVIVFKTAKLWHETFCTVGGGKKFQLSFKHTGTNSDSQLPLELMTVVSIDARCGFGAISVCGFQKVGTGSRSE